MTVTCDHLFVNAAIINAQGEQISSWAIAVKDGLIHWCGPQKDLPTLLQQHAEATTDCHGTLVTPGLIDCHTHLVYAGHRALEFKLKLDGLSYAAIAKAGGGILSTVAQTRAASEDDLVLQSLPRVLALRNEGVTTVEIKSGYGLDLDNEIKMLKAARRLEGLSGVRVRTTFLGAHAIGPEFKGDSQAYIDYLCAEMLPAIKSMGLADAVDVFCETIAFSKKQTEQVFLAANSLELPIKCHAEQLTNIGASDLAAKMGALSCDHLEFLDEAGALAMARAGTVAVLLPGAFYFLRENQKPPIELLRKEGVKIAIATDCNPGSSPTTSLLLMMNMACQFFGLTVPEAWLAVTAHAAKALGMNNAIGSLTVGMHADLVLWSINDSALPCYTFAYPLTHRTMIGGNWVNNEIEGSIYEVIDV
jgi:imidazolonepropionase